MPHGRPFLDRFSFIPGIEATFGLDKWMEQLVNAKTAMLFGHYGTREGILRGGEERGRGAATILVCYQRLSFDSISPPETKCCFSGEFSVSHKLIDAVHNYA